MKKVPTFEAVDCHVHIVGPAARFPQVARRAYTAGLATLESLRARSGPVGIGRYVLVQPSFYGLDNSCLFEALDLLGGRGRGVIVMDTTDLGPCQIEKAYRRGACGIRINCYSKFNALGINSLEDGIDGLASALPSSGWHLEILAELPVLLRARKAITYGRLPIVIDHYGLPRDTTPDSEAGKRLLEMLSLPHVWVKLSAAYRFLADPLTTDASETWLAAFLQVARDRCLWGSDWPHPPVLEHQTGADTPIPYRALEYDHLLGNFLDALPDITLAQRILYDNPTRLYRFSPSSDGQEQET